MKVIVNGIEYDSEETPILIELTKADKRNIENMHEDKFKYMVFNNEMDFEDVKRILNIDEKGNYIK